MMTPVAGRSFVKDKDSPGEGDDDDDGLSVMVRACVVNRSLVVN
jgi:hypothetical protein